MMQTQHSDGTHGGGGYQQQLMSQDMPDNAQFIDYDRSKLMIQ